MNPNLPIVLYAVAYLALFAGAVDLAHVASNPLADRLFEFVLTALGALTGHILTMINPRAPSKPPASPGEKQAGRALPFLLLILAVGGALALGGCASLQNAGSSSMTLKPFVTDAKTGATVCCEVSIADGKQRASLTLNAAKKGDDYTFSLDEKGVEAFQGQAIAAGATQAAIDSAAKAAVVGVLAPILPSILPMLAAPGATSAAVGAAGALGVGKLMSSGAAAVPAPTK